jgi:hypothetical protein
MDVVAHPADRPARRGGRAVAACLIAGTLTLTGGAAAQVLVDVVLVPAIASQLHPVMSMPRGTMRAEGAGAVTLIARVPDSASWTDWEVYTASGLAATLAPAVLSGVERDFALAGLWRSDSQETVVGEEQHTRLTFEGDGRRALLYVIRHDRTVVWMLARGR